MSQVMARPTQHDALEQWKRLLEDPTLNNLPYKIETNERGQLILSPVTKRHTFLQYLIAEAIRKHLVGDYELQELSILTSAGVRVVDVAWSSVERFDVQPDELFVQAPEICVEVWSPSNTLEEFEQKKRLYFEAGALEVWTCSKDGKMRFFVPTGELEGSKLVAEFPGSINQNSSS
jgi:Uma2 family endonuclease